MLCFSLVVHLLTVLSGCSDSVNESEFLVSLDQNEILYEDFNSKQQINRLPLFLGEISLPELYITAADCRDRCLLNLNTSIALMNNPAENRGDKQFYFLFKAAFCKVIYVKSSKKFSNLALCITHYL